MVIFEVPYSNGHKRKTIGPNVGKLDNTLKDVIEIYFSPKKKKKKKNEV